MVIEIPPVVRNKALVAGVEQWLEEVDALVADLASEWEFTPRRVFPDASEALVLTVDLVGGTPAVLKLMIPRQGDHAENEISVLRLVDGDGCPRLLRWDVERGAMLLERLGSPMSEMGLPIAKRQEILCAAARRIWRRVDDVSLPTGADRGRDLAESIQTRWERLDRPLSSAAVDRALGAAERRIAAHEPATAVLVHGDVHQWNALESPRGFLLVDPDGLIAEPEYDLGILMREDPLELIVDDPWSRARHLAAATGCDAAAIWEWGLVERVATGLLLLEIDLQPVAGQMLAAAEHVARTTLS
ncbi:MAG TPA: aminoglycoside phosphotransferase family protein [Acidimicrobiia bacterium]